MLHRLKMLLAVLLMVHGMVNHISSVILVVGNLYCWVHLNQVSTYMYAHFQLMQNM